MRTATTYPIAIWAAVLIVALGSAEVARGQDDGRPEERGREMPPEQLDRPGESAPQGGEGGGCPMCQMMGEKGGEMRVWGVIGAILLALLLIATIVTLLSRSVFFVRRSRLGVRSS